MLQTVYRGLTHLGGPAIRYYMARRRAAGKEDPIRHNERRGFPSCPRPPGAVIWLHGASIGESLSILALLQQFLNLCPDAHALITTGTITSAQILAHRLPPQAFHQYIPIDRPGYVRRFLNHWRPNLALWIESELWPNLLWEAQQQNIPAALINARMSPDSFRRWNRAPRFIRNLLSTFQLCLAQTQGDAERLTALGAPEVRCVGNLKFSADPPPVDPDALTTLQHACENRPCWLLASSHPGEDEIALSIHETLATSTPDLLTIIAPRHPHRGAAIAAMAKNRQLSVARRSTGDAIASEHAVYVADTIGEMGLWYRLAPVVWIGGSMAAHGGQNPIEPAQLGCAVVYGPHMHNFSAITAELEAANAALPVSTIDQLTNAVGELLHDPAKRTALGVAAQTATARGRDAAARVLEALKPLMRDFYPLHDHKIHTASSLVEPSSVKTGGVL
ncbi:3-deoxy-D-manno-octulosonic acid transferase [Azospirillaceae bacterium]